MGKSTGCPHATLRVRVYEETAIVYGYDDPGDGTTAEIGGPERNHTDTDYSDTVVYCLDCGQEWGPDYPENLKVKTGVKGVPPSVSRAMEAFEKRKW